MVFLVTIFFGRQVGNGVLWRLDDVAAAARAAAATRWVAGHNYIGHNYCAADTTLWVAGLLQPRAL